MRVVTKVVLLLLVSGSLVGLAWANGAAAGDETCIVISPKTLVLSAPVAMVTVHSNIPYSTVDTTSLELDGVPVRYTKADSRGELVAKFLVADVEAILVSGEMTLTLAGSYKDGTEFSVSDTITVKL